MGKEQMTIKALADKQMIVVDYSDDDIIIIDSIKQLAEPNPTRIRMNVIAVAKKGRAEVSFGDQRVTIGENQLLLCPPNTVFNDFMFSPDFEFRAIFLTNSIIQSFLREKMSVWNETMYINKMHVVTLQPRDIDFMFHLYSTLQILIDAPDDTYLYKSETIQGLVRSAILGFCGVLKSRMPKKEKEKQTHGDNIFQQFLDLVNDNRTKSRTVEDFASQLCISPKYLSLICKKASGKTANEWIKEHILEEIRYYLKQTDMSMKQIADQLGFANPSFFGKYVKEHFGMTPMQFRKKKLS